MCGAFYATGELCIDLLLLHANFHQISSLQARSDRIKPDKLVLLDAIRIFAPDRQVLAGNSNELTVWAPVQGCDVIMAGADCSM